MSSNTLFKTFTNALLQRVKSFRGNWEQNDPTADDYIANRPFYTSIKNKACLENEKIACFDEEYGIWGYLPLQSPFVEGSKYVVTYDGVEYERIARNDGWDDIYIGNPQLPDWYDEYVSSNEPFFMYTYEYYDEYEDEHYIEAYICCSDVGVHTISIVQKIEEVTKIDDKYLPLLTSDWNAFEGDVGYIANKTHGIEPVIDNVSFTYEFYTNSVGLESGTTYSVIFDDVEYKCVAYMNWGDISLGHEATPFMIYDNSDTNTFRIRCYNDDEHTISVIRYNKLDPIYLPDKIDIKCLPEGYPYVEIEYPSVFELEFEAVERTGWLSGTVAYGYEGYVGNYISGTGFNVIDYTYPETPLTIIFDGVEYSCEVHKGNAGGSWYALGDTSNCVGMGVYVGNGEPFCIVSFGGPTKLFTKTLGYHTITVLGNEGTEIPVPMSEEFIPDTIARVSDIETMIQTQLGVIENGTY